jgi:acetyl-CoA synthetase
MDSEDTLFLLYTSGSTGKPKGLIHTQAGYLLYAAVTQQSVFNYKAEDVFGCVADVGWITGHSEFHEKMSENNRTEFCLFLQN